MLLTKVNRFVFPSPSALGNERFECHHYKKEKKKSPLNIFSVLEMLVPVVINRYNRIVVKYWTFQVPLLYLPAALWQPFLCLKFYMLWFDSGICSRDIASKFHSVLFWTYFEFLCEETLGFSFRFSREGVLAYNFRSTLSRGERIDQSGNTHSLSVFGGSEIFNYLIV